MIRYRMRIFLLAAATIACANPGPATAASQSTTSSAPKPGTIHLEAEDGDLVSGTVVLKSGTGFTGKGYVGGFLKKDAAVHFRFAATAGIYDVRIRYRTAIEKGFDLVVNGKTTSAMFAPSPGQEFATQAAGKIELNAGINDLAIVQGWGHYEIDSLDLVPASDVSRPLRRVAPSLTDPKATQKTRELMQFLVSRYGEVTLSGQQNLSDTAFIRENVGVTPAIQSLDLIDYSPTRAIHGGNKQVTTEQMIGAYRAGQLLSVMWHWNAPADLVDTKQNPWYMGFYTKATTFDVAKALADPKSADYRLLLSNMDTIAAELKKLQDSDIPVLWRPLHEAEGGWFWWGAKGPDAFKALWHLMYDRFVNYHGLHNLIWVYTSGGKKDWYPGDDVVDIVGADAYPSDPADPLSSIWEQLLSQHDGRKMVTLSEYGGVPDVDRMARFGVRWLYFDSWGGELGPKKPSLEQLRRLYKEPRVVNSDGIREAATVLSRSAVN